MRKLTTTGFICLEDDYKFIYKIAKIEYEEWEDGAFNYRFRPFYNVINMLPPNLFQGIPGLDLSLEKAVYERKNIVPTFISERTPSERREDLWELMDISNVACNAYSLSIKFCKRCCVLRCGVKKATRYGCAVNSQIIVITRNIQHACHLNISCS